MYYSLIRKTLLTYIGLRMPKGRSSYIMGNHYCITETLCGRIYQGEAKKVKTQSMMHKRGCEICTDVKERENLKSNAPPMMTTQQLLSMSLRQRQLSET